MSKSQYSSTGVAKKTLRIVDGSSFIFRAFYGLPMLNAPDGTPINAVYGMCSMLLKLLESRGKDQPMIVVFDAGRENFRHKIYPAYKANRGEPPEELIPQFEIVRESVAAFGIPQVERIGYEADDLIAAYVKSAAIRGMNVEIISSDKDLMQLIDDKAGVSMYDSMKNKSFHEAEVLEKFGVAPNRVVDVQALAGDSSDNVPGVPSIGPKTASQLINEFGTLEEVFEHLDQIKQDKRRQVLTDHKDDAFLSKQLVSLDSAAPMPIQIDAIPLHVQTEEKSVMEFFEKYGFHRLKPNVERILSSEKIVEQVIDVSVLSNKDLIEKFIHSLKENVAISFLTESNHPKKMKAIGVAIGEGKRFGYIPLRHVQSDSQSDLFNEEKRVENQIDPNELKDILKGLIDNSKIIKLSNQLKSLFHCLKNDGIYVKNKTDWHDITVQEYCLNGLLESLDLDKILKRYSVKDIHKISVLSEGAKIKVSNKLSIDDAARYACHVAYAVSAIYRFQETAFKKDSVALAIYEKYDHPLISVLADMEQNGIVCDSDFLNKMGQDLSKKIHALEQDIHQKAGHEFNVASPKQMGDVLFNKMKLPYKGRKTSTGEFATGVDQLDRLKSEGHAIADDILKWREYSKLYNTYIEGLMKEIDSETGRIYTTYNQTAVNTARLASSHPNLQNIPIRTALGREIRKAFVAADGYELLSVDYSQMELRLIADIANVKNLKESFLKGDDIHASTASKVFNVPMDQMDPITRRRAKEINFGIIYGMSKFGLAGNLGISTEKADSFIKAYFGVYPEIKDYMDQMKKVAKDKGYVETMAGRKIYMPRGIGRDANFMSRVAINAPIQGSAADIMRLAMIRVHRALDQSKLDAKMLLQIHDEIVFEVRHSDADQLMKLVVDEMEKVVKLSVPIPAEGGIGKNWYDAH